MMGFFYSFMDTITLYRLFKKSTGISTDTRKIRPGNLFFAIKGDNYDGNEYVREALASGASAVVTDNPSNSGVGLYIVKDSLVALQKLARHHRRELNVPVLAITGSNGKTTTKELIARVLSQKFRVHSTTGNLNNHIGVPLTLLEADNNAGFQVIEMGANHQREIAALCEIAEPNYGIITNIGKAHVEGFGSLEGVIKGKGELYDWLRANKGIAIFNEANPTLKDLVFRKVVKAVPYSDPTGVDVVVKTVDDSLNLNLSVTLHGVVYYLKTSLFGKHNIENIRAAIAVGIFFDIDIDKIIAAIQSYVPSNNRSQILDTKRNTIICDAYNANPTSMIETLRSFSVMDGKTKAVILGDMLEQGENSYQEHEFILSQLKEFGIDKVYIVGDHFGYVNEPFRYNWFPHTLDLAKELEQNPVVDSLVLVKGSRGVGLEKIFEYL